MARLGRAQHYRPLIQRFRITGAPPAQPPVFQTSSTLAGATSGSAAVPVPSGVQADDVIVVFGYLESSATVTPPAGFAEKTQTTDTNELWHRLWWKRATGADSGTYTFTFTSTWSEWHALRISACVTSGDPFDATNTNVSDPAVTTSPAVSLTTTVDQTLLVWSAATFAGSDSWTGPTSFTVRTNLASAGTATLTQAAAGGTGSLTGTTDAAASMTAILGALKGVPVGGGDVPKSLTDSGAGADALSLARDHPETGTAGDALALARDLPEQGAAGDALGLARQHLDSGSGTDTLTVDQGTVAKTLADAGTASDTLTIGVALREQGLVTDTNCLATGPVTISSGGVYSGCYQSDDATVPAVTIATTASVVFDRATFRGKGSLVFAQATTGTNVRIYNSTLEGLDPGSATDHPAVYLLQPASFVFEHNRLVNTQRVLLNGNNTATSPLKIRFNDYTDLGRWNTSDLNGAVHFDKILASSGARIVYNRIRNRYGFSVCEDVVGLFESNGAAGRLIEVAHNLIDGSYPYTGDGSGFTGGGIDTGDSSGSYQVSHDNTVVRVTNNGLMIPAGDHLEHYHNRTITSGIADDGTRVSSTFGNGLNLWDNPAYPGTPSVVSMHHNSVNHRRWTGSAWERSDQNTPASDPAGASSNNVLGTYDNADWDGPTNGTTLGTADDAAWLAEIQDAIADWETARTAVGVIIGPLPYQLGVEEGEAEEGLRVAASVTLADAGTATDTLALARDAADQGTATEAVSLDRQHPEQGAAAEALPIGVAAFEQATAGDALGLARQVLDAGTASEVAGLDRQIPDAGAAADSVTVGTAVPVTATDVGTASETVSLVRDLPEAGTGSEALGLARQVLDSGQAGQQATIGTAAAEQGTAADSLRVTATVPLADLATAAEQVALAVLLILAEQATAAEDLSILIPPPVPPPRWTEGATAASGLTEGTAASSGRVEGVLVGSGRVEGSAGV